MAWIEFAVALLLFLGSHRIPAMAGIKAPLEAALGRRGYVVLFSVVSTALLLWVIFAAGRAPHVPLWDQALWQRWLVNACHADCHCLGHVWHGGAEPVCL